MHPMACRAARWFSTPRHLALAAVVVLASQGAAHAQTRYTMTTLNTGLTRCAECTIDWVFIDRQDRVFGNLQSWAGYKTTTSPTGQSIIVSDYKPYAVRWAATTASWVLPFKLKTTTGTLQSVSPNGNHQVFNPKGLPVNFKGETGDHGENVLAVNDLGVQVGTYQINRESPNPTTYAAMWSAGPRPVLQPLSVILIYTAPKATVVNGRNEAAGELREPSRLPISHAVMWNSNQQGGTLDTSPNTASRSLAINDAGQVLVAFQPYTPSSLYGPARYSLIFNRVETPITANDPEQQAIANGLNASGAVVGRLTRSTQTSGQARTTAPDMSNAAGDRAFIWANGALQDLTDLVLAKGVKLPAGAVLTNALAINDKGSIVANLREASGATSVVRLTARP